jgi:DNA (cytosine-5)-methyltransferase 1
MKHLDLFSGIGGFALAARWMSWETIQFVEIDKFCQKVLTKNFPNVPIHGDIKTFDGSSLRGAVDILTGGFPCQPFSVAGKRKGKEDDRFLWPEMLRIIGEVQPSFIVGENVSGSWQLVDEICHALETQGFTTEPISLEAAGIGAPHKRERYWFLAYSNKIGLQTPIDGYGPPVRIPTEAPNDFSGFDANQWTIPKRYRGELRTGNGIPNWMDRISGLGNAIVPQVAFEIFKAIEIVK